MHILAFEILGDSPCLSRVSSSSTVKEVKILALSGKIKVNVGRPSALSYTPQEFLQESSLFE